MTNTPPPADESSVRSARTAAPVSRLPWKKQANGDTAAGSTTSRARTSTKSSSRTRGTLTRSRFDSQYATSTEGLTNARTKLVGTRTGFFADVVVGIVRLWRLVRRIASGVWRRLAAVVTPLGWTTLAIVPVAFVAGYALGWLEIAAVAWAGLVLLVVAAIWLLGAPRVEIALQLPHPRVVVGEDAAARVEVRNPSARRSLGTVVEVPVGAGLVELVVPSLGGGAVHRAEVDVPSTRRGVVPVGPARTVRADPLGLVRREKTWSSVSTLTVHPRTISIPATSIGMIRDLEGNPTRDLSNTDVSFHALREYVPGDERRHIHWKASARTGALMVRQYEETRRSQLVVALSVAAGDYATPDEFELAVGVAGSLGVRAIRDARDITVVVGERTGEFAKRKNFEVRSLSVVTPSRLLDDLAVVETAETALRLTDVSRVAATKVGGISVAFLVSGSLPSAQELRAASAQFPLGVEVVAIVCDPEAVPGMRRLTGLRVLTIGYLDDLKAALAKSVIA